MHRKCQLCDKPGKKNFYTKSDSFKNSVFKWYVCSTKHALQLLQMQIREYKHELCDAPIGEK